MARKARIRLTLALCVVAIAVIAVNHLNRDDSALDKRPASLDAPLIIPIQRGFAPLNESKISPVEAKETWARARRTFQLASSDIAAVEQAAPLLKDIWRQWPDTHLAVQAQLFYIGALKANGFSDAGLTQSQAFLDRAIQSPPQYFSGEYQASSQMVANHVIQAMIEKGNEAQAWQLCIRLRWLAPRIDLIVPVCQGLIDESPDLVLAPTRMLDLLSPLISIYTIPVEKLNFPLAEAVERFLSSPYDEDALSKAIIELYKGGFKEISRKLLLELLEIDPMKMPKTEIEIDKLEAAEQS